MEAFPSVLHDVVEVLKEEDLVTFFNSFILGLLILIGYTYVLNHKKSFKITRLQNQKKTTLQDMEQKVR